jgi:peptidylprolyl isomerase
MAKLPDGDNGTFVPDTASSQFAILFLPIAIAVKQQTVFGRVIEGMDAVGRLQRIDPSKEKGKGEIVIPADRILRATVIRKPDELPKPQYLNLNTVR